MCTRWRSWALNADAIGYLATLAVAWVMWLRCYAFEEYSFGHETPPWRCKPNSLSCGNTVSVVGSSFRGGANPILLMGEHKKGIKVEIGEHYHNLRARELGLLIKGDILLLCMS